MTKGPMEDRFMGLNSSYCFAHTIDRVFVNSLAAFDKYESIEIFFRGYYRFMKRRDKEKFSNKPFLQCFDYI